MRGLTAAGGILLVVLAWPVASGAWLAQRADSVLTEFRNFHPVPVADIVAASAALDRAVAADPVAGRRLQRAELLVAAALETQLKPTPEQRKEWLQRAKPDLEAGLAAAPARGLDWLRLAVVRQALDGAGRDVVAPLMMSIDMAPMLSPIWEVRLRIILDNWGYFTEAQREQIKAYVIKTWRRTDDRLWFGRVVRDAIDEVIVRNLLRDEPGAQQELTKWIRHTRK